MSIDIAQIDKRLSSVETALTQVQQKLGLAPSALGEFHIVIETKDLAQLDSAFNRVASRREPIESVHHGVNSLVCNAMFGLYRDFPDPVRHSGEEKF